MIRSGCSEMKQVRGMLRTGPFQGLAWRPRIVQSAVEREHGRGELIAPKMQLLESRDTRTARPQSWEWSERTHSLGLYACACVPTDRKVSVAFDAEKTMRRLLRTR